MAPAIKRPAHKAASSSPAKRSRHSPKAVGKAGIPQSTLDMWRAIHQFSLVGGADYQSKELRLEQTLARLPPAGSNVVVFADAAFSSIVEALVERHLRAFAKEELASVHEKAETASDESTRASSGADSSSEDVFEAEPSSCTNATRVHILVPGSRKAEAFDFIDCHYIINYSFPVSGRKYLELVAKLCHSQAQLLVVFTLVDDCDLGSRRCREVMALIRKVKVAAQANPRMAGVGKAEEFKAALEQLKPHFDGADEGEDYDDSCDCHHCLRSKIGGRSYHAPNARGTPTVESVHVHVGALENMSTAAPAMASYLTDHVCTVVCLHCLYCHTPWDSDQHLFALPPGMGAVRVVFALADDTTWHEYPDSGTVCAGTPWMDMLDMASMDKADRLLERLVDHEIDLLNGKSERVVLMGVSQGGCQAMLRFLRSRQPLGGWVGGVTHAATMPHTPRDRDPLLENWRPPVNRHKPIRFLAGAADSVFPPAMVLRDAERLRAVGGFTDVQVEVMESLAHDAYLPEKKRLGKTQPKTTALEGTDEAMRKRMPDLHFLCRHLPAMLGLAPKV